MEIYSFGRERLYVEGLTDKNVGKTLSDKASTKEEGYYTVKNAQDKASQASLYISRIRARNMLNDSTSNIAKLNMADTYLEKLQVILDKLKEERLRDVPTKDTVSEMNLLKTGIAEILDKFPMLTTVRIRLANWDIRSFLGSGRDGDEAIVKGMEDVAFLKEELKAVADEELKLVVGNVDNAHVKLAAQELSNEKPVEGGVHGNLSTNRIIELIT